MRLHDRRDEVRQVLVPGLDPWALIDEQDLPEGTAIQDQEHDAIHLLGNVAITQGLFPRRRAMAWSISAAASAIKASQEVTRP